MRSCSFTHLLEAQRTETLSLLPLSKPSFRPLRQFVGLEHAGHVPAEGILVLGSWDSPSSRTTRGTLSSSSRQALVIPLAMMAQLTIPPKILTRIASTWNAKQKDLIRIQAEQSQTNWLSNSWNSYVRLLNFSYFLHRARDTENMQECHKTEVSMTNK